jgi:hypothetical protein
MSLTAFADAPQVAPRNQGVKSEHGGFGGKAAITRD